MIDADDDVGLIVGSFGSAERPSRRRRLDVTALPRHTARLQRAALAVCDSYEDAEDLVQETFERVLRRPRDLHADDDLGYLLRVLHNTWVSTHRARARRVAPDGRPEELDLVEDVHADPSERVEGHDAWAAIAMLPDGYRKTLVAVDVLGLTYGETALALQVRTGTVMSRLFRARKRVADALEPAA